MCNRYLRQTRASSGPSRDGTEDCPQHHTGLEVPSLCSLPSGVALSMYLSKVSQKATASPVERDSTVAWGHAEAGLPRGGGQMQVGSLASLPALGPLCGGRATKSPPQVPEDLKHVADMLPCFWFY